MGERLWCVGVDLTVLPDSFPRRNQEAPRARVVRPEFREFTRVVTRAGRAPGCFHGLPVGIGIALGNKDLSWQIA
jgi:hypothetical protein